MRLQVALIFGEHMVLQREKPIRIWGTSAKNDIVTVSLNGQSVTADAPYGKWCADLEPEPACNRTSLEITSKATSEKIRFDDVAIGEVWLAGGQSNMEFIMKYDYDFQETKKLPDDTLLRCFTYPQAAFQGFLEVNPCAESGFWRLWTNEEERKYFSAVATYMGMLIRESQDVPVGIISCNWGGSPAAAWTSMEDLQSAEELKPILDWHRKACEETDWAKYIPASEAEVPPMTQEQLDFNDRFMMGEDMTEFFRNFDPSKLPPVDFAPFTPGPRSTVRPAGLYENMLSKVAPYGLRGFVWYQGEDDDARDWAEFYDVSMITMIQSWRKLWNEELPFYQIELAPFRGIGATGAKKYPLIRHQQAKAADSLPDAFDVCILDAGEEYNIHPRHKKIVGERLGRMVLKHSYGDRSLVADCPRFQEAHRFGDEIRLSFVNTAGKLEVSETLKDYLAVSADGEPIPYDAETDGDVLLVKGSFGDRKVRIEYCETNYCVASLYNAEGNPVFGFTVEVEHEDL